MTKRQEQERSAFLKAHDQWLHDYYAQLVGAKVVGVGIDCALCPIIVFEMVDGKRIHTTLSADEEGNGPGFLQGLPPIKRGRG